MSITSLNLHGQIRLTLIDASAGDVRAVMQATGAREGKVDDVADVEIQFIGDDRQLSSWRKQGDKEVYRTEGQLKLPNVKGKLPIEIELPVGESHSFLFRAVYPTGLTRLPLLRTTLHLKCAENKMLGIHGTAFTHDHHGYLVCGGPRSGKTGVLLAYLLQGAQYLAAEWAYVTHGGQVIHGVPEMLRLRDWHVQNAGTRLNHVRLGDRLRLAQWRYATQGLYLTCRLLEHVGVRQVQRLRQFAERVDRQRYIDRPVADWLGMPVLPRAAPLHTILLVSTHDTPNIQVNLLNRCEAKRQLTALQNADMADLLKANRMWASDALALPKFLKEYYANRAALIDKLVAGKVVVSVARPHDVNLNDLFQAISSSTRASCSLSH